jgi:DnaJ family protein B protein 4
MTNYYDLLGVERNAGETEIKKAFRKMSLQYHPDRNPNEDTNAKFQEINEAFEVLSDPNKRQQYNMEQQMGHGRPMGGMERDMNDINNMFNMMFGHGGGGMPFGMPGMQGMPGMPGVRIFHSGGPGINVQTHFHSAFQRPPEPPIQKPEPIQKVVEITAQQSYYGCTLNAQIDIWNQNNNMRTPETKTIQINIPQGVDNDERFMVNDQGNCINGQIRGDIHFVVRITNYGDFTRQGMDLYLNKKITLKEALCGFNFEFDHYNGKRICMNNTTGNQVIKPGSKKVINGLGMIRDGKTGNLIVEFDVVFPETLTEDQCKGLNDILPA